MYPAPKESKIYSRARPRNKKWKMAGWQQRTRTRARKRKKQRPRTLMIK